MHQTRWYRRYIIACPEQPVHGQAFCITKGRMVKGMSEERKLQFHGGIGMSPDSSSNLCIFL